MAEIVAGLSVEDVLEREAGGYLHRAYVLAELGGNVEAVEMEFQYDDEQEAVELARLCREVRRYLERVSLSQEATLTLDRECPRCDGAGRTDGEDPCVECGGRGSTRAEEADV